MKKVQVKCCEHRIYVSGSGAAPHIVYITYPDLGLGHTLISCLSCGEIYAVDIVAELYAESSSNERLQGMNCVKCNSTLADVSSEYPNSYLHAGEICKFDLPTEIPEDGDMFFKEFYGIYS